MIKPVGLLFAQGADSLDRVSLGLLREMDGRKIPLYFDAAGDFQNGHFQGRSEYVRSLCRRMIGTPFPDVTVTWGSSPTKPYRRRGALVHYLSSHPEFRREQVRYINDADMLLVPSEWSAAGYREIGVTVPVGVVPHGIDMTEFPFTQRKAKKPGEPFTILHVSGGQYYKSLSGVIDAFLQAFPQNGKSKKYAEVTLRLQISSERVVYRGQWVSKADLSAHLDDPRIVFAARPVHGEALAAEYAGADLCLMPSLEEQFPMVWLEASASGLPGVYPNHGVFAEVIDPKSAYLIDRFDADADKGARDRWRTPSVTATADLLRAAYEDPAGRLLRGEKAFEQVKTYTWPRAVDALLGHVDQYR